MARRAKKKATKKKSRKKAGSRRKKAGSGDLIISKARTKAAAGMNVSGEFYAALNDSVVGLIQQAEARAESNGRRTLRPHDL